MSSGIDAVDALTGGVPLGCLTEICGPTSSGRTSVLMSLLAECMRRDALCALIDASDVFDPHSAAAAGVELEKLLWVRCGVPSPRRHGDTEKSVSGFKFQVLAKPADDWLNGNSKPETRNAFSSSPCLRDSVVKKGVSAVEQALKCTDLLLQAGGFGLIALDLGDIPVSAARRIPLTTWFRFRRAVEHTSTALVVLEQQPHAKSCASLVMDFSAQKAQWSEAAEDPGTILGTHFGGSVDSNHFGSNPGPAFRVTAQGIAVPFDRPAASSFETPQRWNTSRARLLNSVHVHLQVSRARQVAHNQKFSPQRHGEIEKLGNWVIG
jgi:hypothetical protein